MSDFLADMAKASRERAAAITRRFRDDELERPIFSPAPGRFGVIAEIKERSPSEGDLARPGLDRLTQARDYADGGAVAVSVLTEPSRFGGELSHLDDVAGLLADRGIPAMRKDFLVDPLQLVEARAAGASGALLIAAMLDDAALRSMLDCALDHGLFVLLEAFDEDDLARSSALLGEARYGDAAADARLLVGVNTRNLRTLAVDTERLRRLAPRLPAGASAVAESGIATASDAAEAAELGYSLALVGSALMRADDPVGLLRELRRAGNDRQVA